MSCITNQSLRGDTSIKRRTEANKKISDILPKTEILAQLAEEAPELAQAALKLRRALDGTNSTPKSVEECKKAFEEEYADVVNCIIALDLDDSVFDRMQKMEDNNISGQLSMDDLMEDNNV